MSFNDDGGNSSCEDLPVISLMYELENSFSEERSSWSEIADKFRCLIVNFKFSALIEFMDSLLTFIRRGPKDSQEFTETICKYLFATKKLTSNETVDKSYHANLRPVLVLHIVLRLRLINCFDDDSMVASDILLKINLLMQGSTSITALDILVDLDEQIIVPRSKSIMKTVYRNYLTKSLSGELRVLEDTNFMKYLILFRSWYSAEIVTEKVNVYKLFMSTIKPLHGLRSNPSFSLLHTCDSNEADDYKKWLQQPFPRNALVRALRIAESENCYDSGDVVLPDMSINDETAIKVEAGLYLNEPNEIIIVDDDMDVLQISYLPKHFERLEAVNICEERISAHQADAPMDIIDLVSSDSDTESTVSVISEANGYEDVTSMNFHNDDVSAENITIIQPILRKNRFNATPLGMSKNVTFKNPLATTYEFERYNYHELSNDAHNSGSSNNNIVTEMQCHFPYETSAVATHTSTISSTQTDIESVASESSKAVGKFKIVKRKSSHFSNRKMKRSRTSIDDWMKRKRLSTDATSELTPQSGITEESSASVLKSKEFDIKLNRLSLLTGQSVEKESVKRTAVLTVDSTSSLAPDFDKGFILLERVNTLKCPYRQTTKSFTSNRSTNCERTTVVKNASTSKIEGVTSLRKLTVNLSNREWHSIPTQLEIQPDLRMEISMTSQTQPESTSDANHCKNVSVMKIHREVSTCSPDTTTSCTPQNILFSDVNTEVQTENDVALNAGNGDLNSNKCLQMACDDCDNNDIPSPMYSPYNGNHKNFNDDRSKSNIAANHFSLVLNESQTDDNTITPIDVEDKLR